MSKTRSVPKTRFFPQGTRDQQRSNEVWLTEPFDEEFELWTTGTACGFVWAVMPADAQSPRCRIVTRKEGIKEITEQLNAEPDHVVLAGNVFGDTIEVELVNFYIHMNGPQKPVDTSESTVMLTRVCERLKDLQYYDGGEYADKNEGNVETFWDTIGLGVHS